MHVERDEPRACLSESEIVRIASRAVELFKQQHPHPTHVTQMQAAEMLGISRWTVSKMVKTSNLKLNRCGLVPIEQIDRARSAFEYK
ncbi:DNA-binding protein [Burkholderia dolosa]|nr:DNA-binding protein [Burkholderia dolosa]